MDRVESVALSAASAARHMVEPYITAVRSTGNYLSVDHTQVLDATMGFTSKLVDQRRAFLNELGDLLRGKPATQRPAKARSNSAAA